jgi:hypothetical protein
LKAKYLYWVIILVTSGEVIYLSINNSNLNNKVAYFNELVSKTTISNQDTFPNYVVYDPRSEISQKLLRYNDSREILLFMNMKPVDVLNMATAESIELSQLNTVYRLVFLFDEIQYENEIKDNSNDSVYNEKVRYEAYKLESSKLSTVPKNGLYHLSFEGRILRFFMDTDDTWPKSLIAL